MKYDRLRGSTSNMVRVFIPDNTSTTGGGLTGLTNASTNLAIAYIRELDSAATVYSGANIEAQTTIGTYQAPSLSTRCRFKEVDTTNFPGMYELQFHNSATIFGTGDASRNVQLNVYELATTALKIGPNLAEIRLIAWDMQTALSSTPVGQISVKKNTALSKFPFVVKSSSTHLPQTGLTVTGTRNIDNAGFAATANAVSEVANGWYVIDLAASDLNGGTIALRFTAPGADDCNFTIVTQL